MRWFEGVVEDRIDPLELGRVRVRVFGIHTEDLALIPREELHWMQVMLPVTSPSNSGNSETAQLLEYTHVIGFFRDSDNCQDGVVIGTVNGIPQKFRDLTRGFNDLRENLGIAEVPGKPVVVEPTDDGVVIDEGGERHPYPLWIEEADNSRLARNEFMPDRTVNVTRLASRELETGIPIAFGGAFDQPEIPYDALYPYNQVTEFESGHIMEFDNTPLKERINISHRTGSFYEMMKDGQVVYKSAWRKYEHIHGDAYEHVNKTKVLTIDDSFKILVNADKGEHNLLIEIGEGGDWHVKVNEGNVIFDVNGDVDVNATGTITLNAGKDIILRAGGAIIMEAGDGISASGTSFNVNAGDVGFNSNNLGINSDNLGINSDDIGINSDNVTINSETTINDVLNVEDVNII
jgi:hypothetical protein